MTERLYHIDDFAKSSEEAAVKTQIFTTEKTGGVVWVLKPGQEVKRHIHTTSDDIWICIEGEGVFYPEPDKEIAIKAGDILVNHPSECHGMKNTGNVDFKFIGILAPVPADFQAL